MQLSSLVRTGTTSKRFATNPRPDFSVKGPIAPGRNWPLTSNVRSFQETAWLACCADACRASAENRGGSAASARSRRSGQMRTRQSWPTADSNLGLRA
jgi:hypothetical protein